MKKLATVAAVLFTLACSTTNSSKSPYYILLSQPNQIQSYDYETNLHGHGFYIDGTLAGGGFRPAGTIAGNGDLCTAGNDWLSLSDLRVHTSAEGKTPVAPYVLGCAKGNAFQPATRTIVMQ